MKLKHLCWLAPTRPPTFLWQCSSMSFKSQILSRGWGNKSTQWSRLTPTSPTTISKSLLTWIVLFWNSHASTAQYRAVSIGSYPRGPLLAGLCSRKILSATSTGSLCSTTLQLLRTLLSLSRKDGRGRTTSRRSIWLRWYSVQGQGLALAKTWLWQSWRSWPSSSCRGTTWSLGKVLMRGESIYPSPFRLKTGRLPSPG